MEVNKIIKKLNKKHLILPKKLINEARNSQYEITELLLQNLENLLYNPDIIKTDYLHIYSLFLLAEFKEKRAFPIIIKILNKINVTDLKKYLGKLIPEGMDSILASTFNGDLQALYNMLENNLNNECLRSTALFALSILYYNKIIDKITFVNYLKDIFNNIKDSPLMLIEDYFFIITDLKLLVLRPEIEKLCNLNLLDYYIDLNEEFNSPQFKKYEYINDAISGLLDSKKQPGYKI